MLALDATAARRTPALASQPCGVHPRVASGVGYAGAISKQLPN